MYNYEHYSYDKPPYKRAMEERRRLILGSLMAISLIGVAADGLSGGSISRTLRSDALLSDSFNTLWGILLGAILVLLVLELANYLPVRPAPGDKAPDLQRFTSSRAFRRAYAIRIWEDYRSSDVKNILSTGAYTLDQKDVFVALRLSPEAPGMIDRSMIAVDDTDADQPRTTIWSFLAIPQGPWAWLAKRSRHRAFAIIGGPGSGKTTLLKDIALSFAEQLLGTRSLPYRYHTPIVLFLREHYEQIISTPDLTLAQLVQQFVRARWQIQAPSGWFESSLRSGRCIVLLDGLDEVVEQHKRRLVAEWIEHQMSLYYANYFIVTSRPLGYRSCPLSKVQPLAVLPFDASQIETFVQLWYQATESKSAQRTDDGVRRIAREGAADLLKRLSQNPALSALAVNPLLLTMITTVHRYRGKLPGRRAELYKEICEVSLGRRRHQHDWDLVPFQKQRVIETLAYRMMADSQRAVSFEQARSIIAFPLEEVNPHAETGLFLKMIEETSGLIIEAEAGTYKFAHLTFQEYLAATYAQRHRLEHELIQRVSEDGWHETILLYVAQEDASAILTAAITRSADSLSALSLAIKCLSEAAAINPELRRGVTTLLQRGVNDPDETRRKHVAEALLMVNLQQMALLSERSDRSIGTALVNQTAYRLFLEEQAEQGFDYTPDHWRDVNFDIARAREEILGVRPQDAVAFCAWLTERDVEGWRYDLPTREEAPHWSNHRSRYWVKSPIANGGVAFECAGPLIAPEEQLRAFVLESFERDLHHLQSFALIVLYETLSSEVRELGRTQGRELNLEQDRRAATTLAELVRSGQQLAEIGMLSQERTVGASSAELVDVFAFAADRLGAYQEQIAEALRAAHESALARRRNEIDRARIEAERCDRVYRAALSSISPLSDVLQRSRSQISQIAMRLPRYFDEHWATGKELRKLAAMIADANVLIQVICQAGKLMQHSLVPLLREHIFVLDPARFEELARQGAFPLDYTYALACAQIFERKRAQRSAIIEAVPERAYLRLWTLLCGMLSLQRASLAARNDLGRTRVEKLSQVPIGLYLDLVLLEGRIAGRLPAVEGVRLIREPKSGGRRSGPS